MLTQLRLGWRLQRWELAFCIGGSLLVAFASVVVAWQLDANRDALDACYDVAADGPLTASCRSAIEFGNLLSSSVAILGTAATAAPFAAGILLGAPLVAREIEHRTAPLAWSLSRSRRRWLAWRVLPVLALLAIALLAVGQGSEHLLRTSSPGELGFPHLGMFGPLVAARGLAILGIGLLLGVVVGRVLPALLLTALATAALMLGLSVARDQLQRDEAVWMVMDERNMGLVQMVYDSGFRSDATGEIITWEQAYAAYPEVFDDETGSWVPPGMSQAWLTVPPDRFDAFVLREGAALLGVFTLSAGLSLAVVVVRRPA